jgi:hypothetical protein
MHSRDIYVYIYIYGMIFHPLTNVCTHYHPLNHFTCLYVSLPVMCLQFLGRTIFQISSVCSVVVFPLLLFLRENAWQLVLLNRIFTVCAQRNAGHNGQTDILRTTARTGRRTWGPFQEEETREEVLIIIIMLYVIIYLYCNVEFRLST